MRSLSDLLSLVDGWRHLPAYGLERRVDPIFGSYLPKVLGDLFEISAECFYDIIPEFPLHKGMSEISTNPDNNQSVNVDFAVFCSSPHGQRVFLVELKTDDKFINEEQLCNMVQARGAGTGKLLCGVIKSALASSEKRKYAQLLWQLGQIGCLVLPPTFKQMRMRARQPGLTTNFRKISVSEAWSTAKVELVLIAPNATKKKLQKPYKYFCCVCFQQLAGLIDDGEQFNAEFAQYLNKWAKASAGSIHPWEKPSLHRLS